MKHTQHTYHRAICAVVSVLVVSAISVASAAADPPRRAKRERSAEIPTTLVAAIEGFKGPSYRLQLAPDGTIEYSDRLSLETRRSRIRVPATRWLAFRRHLDAAKVWSWRRKYIDVGVVDGTSWQLQIAYPGQKITSVGFNAYPPKKQFDEFRVAIQELTGGRRFE